MYGVDLSEVAIRGSILVVASFLETCDQLKQLIAHFACMDSLQVGTGMAARFGLDGFAAVVGNPPWERVRPSRNEYAREHGVIVDYGQAIEQLPDGYEAHRRQSQMTSAALASMYGLKGGMDLYRAFLNLSIGICTNGGLVALYLPAGLIRSKSLAAVRDGLLDGFGAVSISVFMNHARFFPIDTGSSSSWRYSRGTRKRERIALTYGIALARTTAFPWTRRFVCARLSSATGLAPWERRRSETIRR
ncbi:MAG: hypothetical protein ACLU0O_10210 [Collinsella sp.]